MQLCNEQTLKYLHMEKAHAKQEISEGRRTFTEANLYAHKDFTENVAIC